jgi:hypothetical protein
MISTWGIFWIAIGTVLIFESLERVVEFYLQYRFQCKQLGNKKKE